METLVKLFGSAVRVKVIKLFLFNGDTPFDAEDVSLRTKESISKVRKELNFLLKLKLIKKRSFSKIVEKRVRGKKVSKKVRSSGFILNEKFEHLIPLHTFLVSMNHLGPKEIVKKLQKAGVIKLIIVSGVFIHDSESRVDLLVVGDNLKRGAMEGVIKTIESEMGKEIRYAFFETPDFKYRLGLYDKLVRDILDYPHEKLLDKLSN